METTTERNIASRTAISKASVPQKTTTRKRTASKSGITPEERDRLIRELRDSLEKSLEEERLAKEKNRHLWDIPKEKMTAKERRQGIAALKASVKRGMGRRFVESFLKDLENDRDR